MPLANATHGFTFTQATPDTTWTINHTLGRYPIVEVMTLHNGVEEVILPKSIQQINTSQVVITFSEARSGFARLG